MRLVVDSPIGPLGVALDGDVVVGVRFGAPAGWADAGALVSHPATDQLAAYFAGTLTDFAGKPLVVLTAGFEDEAEADKVIADISRVVWERRSETP